MPVITSRGTSPAAQVAALQAALKENMPEMFADEELPDDLDELIDESIMALEALRMMTDELDADCATYERKIFNLQNELDRAQDMLANLIDDVGYDSALDEAAVDLMDCLIASGAAEPTANGEIGFDPRVTFNKEDIKPMLREAIVKWIESRLQA